jgi:microcystin-dependent protein
MASPFLAEIKMFGGSFAPRGYAFCSGQIMAIAQNTALFSLLGTTYGGNGQTTFALPNLQGRVPIHAGQGPGLSNYTLGQLGGSETVTLLQTQLPPHTHAVAVNSGPGNSAAPANNTVLAASTARDRLYTTAASNTSLSPTSVGTTGGGQPLSIIQPYLVINFIIAIEGIYPSRN